MEKFDEKIIEKIVSQYEKLQDKSLLQREYAEHGNKNTEGRSEYARDYARILYSSAFRRLQGKMQILGINSSAFYRNRLTHSLEVSQIARSLARILSHKCGKEDEMYRDEELYLLDAAALAHDIGHPAFGHKGEKVLEEIANKNKLRFEGNAQNFRVLRELDQHGSSEKGHNLTYRTLLAINKYLQYENEVDEKNKLVKKFMYQTDFEFLNRFRNKHQLNTRTLDVQIIELADDIAYAVHDLEDGLSQGVFNIDELIFEIKNYKLNTENSFSNNQIDEAIGLFSQYIEDVKKDIKANNLQQYSHIFRKKLISLLTDRLIRSVTYSETNNELTLDNYHNVLCKVLAKTIFVCITRNSQVATYEKKGEIVIKTLFNIYANKDINQKYMLLPPDYRPNTDHSEDVAQCCIDYIAGMMDTYAIAEFTRLTGISFDNINISKIPDILDLNKAIEDKGDKCCYSNRGYSNNSKSDK